jgi:hypothetical protein
MKLITILKRIFATIISKSHNFISIHIKNSFLNKKSFIKYNMAINVISYTFVALCIYLIIYDLSAFSILKIFIFTIISSAISMFISDNFTISNNN